ncbi:hypothetical protein RUND412_010305, partial [Rhizina undulata]
RLNDKYKSVKIDRDNYVKLAILAGKKLENGKDLVRLLRKEVKDLTQELEGKKKVIKFEEEKEKEDKEEEDEEDEYEEDKQEDERDNGDIDIIIRAKF